MPKIQFKRGLKGTIPTFDIGEPGFTTDTEEVFIGSIGGNIQLAKQSDITDMTDITNKTNWFLSLAMYNAIGDGIADDTAVFTNIETNYTNKLVDMGGKTYYVTSLPINNIYVNGKFYFNSSYIDASYVRSFAANHGVIAIGLSAAKNAPMYPSYSGSLFYKNIAIGGYALQNAISAYNNIAIGWNAMNSVANGGDYYNIAIGNESLYSMSKQSGDTTYKATRNIAIGGNAQRFNVGGYQNLAIGRNSLQDNVNGNQNTALGVNSMSGTAPIDLSGTIVNLTKYDSNNATAVGYNALAQNVANDNTAVGSDSAENIAKAVSTVAVGRNALKSLQNDMTTDGNQKFYWSKTGTYSWSGTTITVTITGHGLSNGNLISLALTSGGAASSEEIQYIITVVDANTFTVTAPVSNTLTGNVSSSWYSNQVANANNSDNNNALGAFSMENVVRGTNNVSVGTWANRNNNSDNNTMIGNLAGTNLTSGGSNTALGYGSLRYMQDGSNATTLSDATAIGYNSRVSGSSQVQLGDSATTTYAYGALQNRSDMRDKADIQDTALGLDFINKIRPVDFKWDYREDYIQINEETGEVTRLPKDGSKKRARYHHGVIAQEVKQLIADSSLDFGGFQDHSLNGGTDVLTIGYEEFIAPLIKAVQELTARVKELESKG